jgi:GntR family transcriptional regulator/MocR family aminotransferase
MPTASQVLRARGGTTLAVEEYSLPSLRETAGAAGLNLVPLPVDGRGAAGHEAGAADAILCTPAHQFPLGAALAPQRRTVAVDWARAAARGLAVAPLAPYRVAGQHDHPALIVGYGTPPEHAFSGAVARLCAVLRRAA